MHVRWSASTVRSSSAHVVWTIELLGRAEALQDHDRLVAGGRLDRQLDVAEHPVGVRVGDEHRPAIAGRRGGELVAVDQAHALPRPGRCRARAKATSRNDIAGSTSHSIRSSSRRRANRCAPARAASRARRTAPRRARSRRPPAARRSRRRRRRTCRPTRRRRRTTSPPGTSAGGRVARGAQVPVRRCCRLRRSSAG